MVLTAKESVILYAQKIPINFCDGGVLLESFSGENEMLPFGYVFVVDYQNNKIKGYDGKYVITKYYE